MAVLMALEGCRSLHLFNVYYYFFYHLLGDAYRKTRKTCFELLQFCRRVHIANAHCKVKFQPYFGNDPYMTCCHTMTKSGSPPPPHTHLFKYIFQQSSCSGAGIWRNSCLCARPSNSADLLYSLTFQSMGGKWGLYHEKKTTQELHRY